MTMDPDVGKREDKSEDAVCRTRNIKRNVIHKASYEEDGEKKRFKTTPQLVKLPSLRLACYIPGFIREAVGNIYLRAYLCVFLCGHLSSPFFFSLSLCSQARSVACWVPRSRKAANVV